MKKKIVFMIINMNVGGTEKALLNMIAEIPKEKFEITILMLEKYGGFLSSIPAEIKVEYINDYQNLKDILNNPPHKSALHLLKVGKFKKAFNILITHLISKICKDRSIFFNYILKDYPEINNEYDIAVAYAGPMDFISYFVVNKIKAKKKIQWIHFDVTKIGFDKHFAAKVYNKFDKVFVVSNEGKHILDKLVPNIKNKTMNFLNIISPKLVVKMSDEGVGFEDDYEGVRILTVGRLSKEKGQDLAISVLAMLRKEGYKVRWYSIGEGGDRKEYEKLINKYKVQDDFILMGSNPNPYPFMKQCDIYVQPSRHEGYCITLSEARCFNNPIVSTNFTGATEQIIHDKTGLIVNFEQQQMCAAIKLLLENRLLRDKLKKNLDNEFVDTRLELNKFIQTLNI
ncbi:glycosyltransferase [Metabacillus halosaccharovorans]|uniref:Glycosyltransferase n=1 Tax=Metabacillus halosaccharovorans TaxID=930124 RepID=A0ABT3DCP3_9BACI|nr:glycosyltransferase [Metabacillus halosaccharovorans]MCV9884800.1 glycosyltransferase [Metabacillus halosaccharovorans]